MVSGPQSGGAFPPCDLPMNVTERAPSARVPDARSPFVRLAELLGDMPPGMPAINIAVGEPQHPIPPFVGIGCCGSPTAMRSEEHTSELQSRFDLVCRLLLEKK